MNGPTTPKEFEQAMARVNVVEASVRDCVKSESALVQLDGVINAYIKLAEQHGQVIEAAQAMLQIGAALLFRQQLAGQPGASQQTAPHTVH